MNAELLLHVVAYLVHPTCLAIIRYWETAYNYPLCHARAAWQSFDPTRRPTPILPWQIDNLVAFAFMQRHSAHRTDQVRIVLCCMPISTHRAQ
jgi:hypothetical protein